MAGDAPALQTLVSGQEAEVLNFLSASPLHTVIMSSKIRDNGLESEQNRGDFYAYRDREGRLQGVALIGHHVLFAARCEAALAAFARQARGCGETQIIVGEQESVTRFWSYYERAGWPPLMWQRGLMLEQTWPVALNEEVPGLRCATLADLGCVLDAHALMIEAERGSNPLKVDPEGFRARLVQRLEQGRVWVWIEEGRLIFKADVVSATPDVFYLEGVYVNPSERGRGYGLRCLTQLSRELLQRTKSLCLLVSEENTSAQNFYRRAGYKPHSNYNIVYLTPRR
ncbi:MAG TPA: GNAT family N-acetyltransferase [Pyrinomonadaceae bacterium]|nr:GNAT family N-acetyltransferase [Pyrinomonadaceae bacterium]